MNLSTLRNLATSATRSLTLSPDVVIALLDEIDEWSKLCNDQNALIARQLMMVWPPERNKCGWCVRAAGDSQEACDALPTMTVDEVRERTSACMNNPLVVDNARLRVLLVEACDIAMCRRCGTPDEHVRIDAIRKELA